MKRPFLLLWLLTLAACADDAPAPGDGQADPGRSGMRIVAVTHGQSSDPFWSVVANGLADAAEDLGVELEYQAPTSFDVVRMGELIEAAVASRPTGLIVTIPDPDALAASLDAARAAGIPTLSINSGEAAWQSLGLLAHVGVNEFEAARAGGERLASAGARSVLCVNHEVGNLALDERCRGLTEALSEAGGRVEVLAVDLADPDETRERIHAVLRGGAVDGILTLGPAATAPTLAALAASNRLGAVPYGTFDLTPEVLAAIQSGEMAFAIDQQPYLQGYLALISLVKYVETGVLAGGGQLIRTGPAFVTRENAATVVELAERGIR